jgi:branched-chain amino acid transport system permease protein
MAIRAISWTRPTFPLMAFVKNHSLTFAIAPAWRCGACLQPRLSGDRSYMATWSLKAFICAVEGGIGNVRGAMTAASFWRG